MLAAATKPTTDWPRTINKALAKISPWYVYGIGMIPAAWYFYLGAINDLGANPIQTFEHLLGEWALRFLIATLLVTPIRELTRVNFVRFRRALGLMAFYYVLMHFSTYMILDRGLDLGVILADILKRTYIIVGMTAFVCLIALAVTSNRWSIMRLGRRWTQLHRLAYLVAILGAVHYLMAVKSWPPRPLVYAAIFAVLLGYRLVRAVLPRLSGQRAAA